MSKYCPYLFLAACIMPDNKVFPCCHVSLDGREDWQYFNNQNPLYFESFIKLRKELAEGKSPKICSKCWTAEDIGLESPRQLAIKKTSKYIITHDDLKIKYLDIKFDNYCNFSCRMCNPWNSSKIHDNIKDNNDLATVFSTTGKIVDAYNFRQEDKYIFVKKLLDDGLDYLKVTGGEPTINKHFILILDYCIENNIAKDITLDITTNGSKFTNQLLSKLINFKQVNYNLSIDGKDKVYEYIRHPFTWNKLVSNIEKLFDFYKNDTNKMTVKSSCIVSVYNFLDILDLEVWWNNIKKDYRYFSIGDLGIDVILRPYDSYLNISSLDNEFIKTILQENLHINVRNYLSNSLNNKKCKKQLLKKNISMLDSYYKKSFEDHLNSKLIEYIKSD